MIKALYIPEYKEYKYGSSFQRLAKYADAANFGGEKVKLLSFDYDPEEPTKSIRDSPCRRNLSLPICCRCVRKMLMLQVSRSPWNFSTRCTRPGLNEDSAHICWSESGCNRITEDKENKFYN